MLGVIVGVVVVEGNREGTTMVGPVVGMPVVGMPVGVIEGGLVG